MQTCLLLVLLLCAEPGDNVLVGEFIDASVGLHFRQYATHGGTVDYQTARQLVDADLEQDVIQSTAEPLFYWQDIDGDGKFACWETWIHRLDRIEPFCKGGPNDL